MSHDEDKKSPRAVLCRTGKIPGRDHRGNTTYKRLGTLTEAKTSATLAVAREFAKILEVDPKDRESKRFPRDFSRWSVGKRFQKVLRSVTSSTKKDRYLNPCHPKAIRSKLVSLATKAENSWTWWAPSGLLADEGYGGWGLDASSTRLLKELHGWTAVDGYWAQAQGVGVEQPIIARDP